MKVQVATTSCLVTFRTANTRKVVTSTCSIRMRDGNNARTKTVCFLSENKMINAGTMVKQEKTPSAASSGSFVLEIFSSSFDPV